MKFQKGNEYGKTSSRKGVPNQINKAECVKLVNMLLTDLTTNYHTLNTYQKLKLFGFVQHILRDTMTPKIEQAGTFKIPEVIFIQKHELDKQID